MTDTRRRWMRWVVRGALVLGVAASVTANILHARDNPISQAISAWPPLALLITVELVTRIPLYRKGLGMVRLLATIAIAGIAAYISYWHMVGVVARYGETGAVPYLLPLSVDGLIIVASVSLVELAERQDSITSAEGTNAMLAVAESTPPALPERTSVPTASSVPSHTAREAMPPTVDDPSSIGDAAQQAPADRAEGDPTERASELLPASPLADADDDQDDEGANDEEAGGLDLAADLVSLLPAARDARDELIREGRTISRDALAHRLRRNGHAIRNNRVSELLTAIRREQPQRNSARPTVSA